MKSIYAIDLKAGDELTNELFLLQDVNRRQTKDGRSYLLGTVRDKSGLTNFVFWNVPDYVGNWAKSGTAVFLTGRLVTYKDGLQINVTDMNPVAQPNLTELLPASQRNQAEMVHELHQHIAQLQEPWRGLVTRLLLDAEFLPRFANAPAARTMHHGYIGGLLEHSLSMAAVAWLLSTHYPHVDANLLLTGTLLHDIGKVSEYDIERGFAHSEDGRLVGHIVRAIILIEQTATACQFPDTLLRQLIHLIASHHGTLEWGSPTTPKTLEAILLHQIDLLDSRVQGFFDHVRSEVDDTGWTTKYSPMFNTELRRPPTMKE